MNKLCNKMCGKFNLLISRLKRNEQEVWYLHKYIIIQMDGSGCPPRIENTRNAMIKLTMILTFNVM